MSELIELSYQERCELESIRIYGIETREYKRSLALLLLDEGESVEEIAELLLVPRRTIYDWVIRYKQRGELSPMERLLDGVRNGRPATAKGIIEPLIEKVIDKDPRKYGYRSTVWTANLLQRYLKEKKKRAVSLRSIGYALSRMEISWKLPRYTLGRQSLFWRQAKGGLKRASGHKIARLCLCWMKQSSLKLRHCIAVMAESANRFVCLSQAIELNALFMVCSTSRQAICSY